MNTRNAVRSYKGKGVLTFSKSQIPCDFECAQLPDARLVCLCLVQGFESEHFMRAMDAFLEPTGAEQLQGQTEEGTELTAYHLHRGRSPLDPHWETDNSYVFFSFLAREMRVQSLKNYDRAASMRFGLANFEFFGTELYKGPRGDETWRRQLPLNIAGHQLTIRPLNDYQARMETIKALRGIDVTSQVIIELDSPDEQKEIIDLIDDLSLLLSLAKGCQVRWVYYDLCSENGQVLETYHHDTVTKPYAPLPLIAAKPLGDMKHFLEQTFDRFREQKERWNLRKVIAAYVDAKLEQDFLESRGLKLAVLMDFLRTHYLSRVGKTTVLPERVFGKKLKTLRQRVLDVLRDVFCDATDQQLALMAKHVQGLKYYPFRQALRDVFATLGLEISSDELQRFVANRNRLVHYGRFRSNDYWQEYASMMHLIDKVLLAILAYDGYYYDWTKPPGGIGRDMEMRVKLELKPTNGAEL